MEILSQIQREDENIVHSFNGMRSNQIQTMKILNYTIQSLTDTQIQTNKAFNRLNGINHLMTLVSDLGDAVQNVILYYESYYKTSSLPIMALDLMSSTDVQKLENKFSLPTNRDELPSLSLLENLKMSTILNFVTFTNEGPALHIKISFKKFSPLTYNIVGFNQGKIALSSDYNTNFKILSQGYSVHLVKRNEIYIKGRFINHYKKHSKWSNEMDFASNFILLTPTIFLTKKQIVIHITCKDSKSVETIEENSAIYVPLVCAISTDFFSLGMLHTTQELDIRHDLAFLKISQRANSTNINKVTHIKISPVTIQELTNSIPEVNVEQSTFDPILKIILISSICSISPWIFVFLFINIKK